MRQTYRKWEFIVFGGHVPWSKLPAVAWRWLKDATNGVTRRRERWGQLNFACARCGKKTNVVIEDHYVGGSPGPLCSKCGDEYRKEKP